MNHKKTGWTITLIAVLAIACGGIVIKLCPRTVPIEECSPVYRKFADMPGIEVSYVKDYRINDSTMVNATLLKATDSIGFEQLKSVFFNKLCIDDDCIANNKKKNAWVTYLSREDYNQPIDKQNIFNNDMVFYCSDVPLSISIFHIKTKEQATAILDKQLAFFINQ